MTYTVEILRTAQGRCFAGRWQMKIGTILRATNKYGAVHLCLGGSFAMSWSSHCMAFEKMEACRRQSIFANDCAMPSIAFAIDWVGANCWLAIAYLLLVAAAVAFLQINGRPPWTHWLAALAFCAPCLAYWAVCAYCANAFPTR